jgi:hypothetical protein
VYSNPNLTDLLFGTGSTFSGTFRVNLCNLTGLQDWSNSTISTSTFHVYSNSSVTGLIFGDGSTFSGQFNTYSCNLTGVQDWSNSVFSTNLFSVVINSNLTELIFGYGSTFSGEFYAYSCNLTGVQDWSNSDFNMTANDTLQLQGNSLLTEVIVGQTSLLTANAVQGDSGLVVKKPDGLGGYIIIVTIP